jgi:hypothetical protein
LGNKLMKWFLFLEFTISNCFVGIPSKLIHINLITKPRCQSKKRRNKNLLVWNVIHEKSIMNTSQLRF